MDDHGAVLLVCYVNRQDANPSVSAAGSATTTPLPSIDLAIRSKDLMLAGKFQNWMPVALETGGKQSQAQVLFDVTSAGPANDAGELFSFVSRDVRRTGPGLYRAKGTLREGDIERPADAIVQVPAEHSPFAAVTFDIDQASFPDVWRELSARVAAAGPNAELRPQRWVVVPTLSAA
jgi:hypothetical protein